MMESKHKSPPEFIQVGDFALRISLITAIEWVGNEVYMNYGDANTCTASYPDVEAAALAYTKIMDKLHTVTAD